ncbi:formylmethanofuran dehydrogenase subunit B [Pseudodesulfovibrio sp. JC047]|uniref:formylmethanofuran dehydrogenase subunit B n=1 Tax=Pseudodesulfovibrio sp. JC047 TaxID=2683199 RepID=UPI0013CF592C|nr:formylmethanofuran dehydrogenase subunit B [Pseudodesulfovibrio sp. JC047]NDV19424.1 formylmethanofuran dehydrogenase subunit B [Pseudodesulfovibrio sp. JC047]
MTVHKNVVCTFCGCLCDDIEVEVEDNTIKSVKKACAIGKNKIMHAITEPPTPSVNGTKTSIDAAVTEAARILSKARNPLIYGLSSTTSEAQRELVEIAEITRGNLDNCSSYCHGPGVLARQQTGLVSCSLGEIKNRADLVIYWGCNPVESHMRHLSRYSLQPKGLYTPEGRKGRKVIAIDIRPTPTTKRADVFLQVSPGHTFEIASALRALIQGEPLEFPEGQDTVGDVPIDSWRKVADMIKGCKYGVLHFGLGVTQCRNSDINVEQVARLVQDANRHTRFYGVAMRGHGNVNGANQVMTWLTGYPLCVNFSKGYPRHNPGEYSTLPMLARKDIDAALIVATDPGAHLPKDAVDFLKTIPTIHLDPHRNLTTPWSSVVIPVAPVGVAATGTFYRMDNVPLRLKKLVDSPFPSDEEVLKTMKEKIVYAANS